MTATVTSLSARRVSTLPTGNTITLQRALQDSANPAALRAVADWNERRVSSARHQAQAAALWVVADGVERGQVRVGEAA